MVQKRTCDYSGQEIEPGTGTMYVKTDGTVLWFADAKCEKNYFMGREARDLEWIGYEEDEGKTESVEDAESDPEATDPDEDGDGDEAESETEGENETQDEGEDGEDGEEVEA
ncbi:50S ribosomal protein L24e [Natronomonas sp.]|uniref:50S ribosomal protein L24e n=1 Tax=Natronomonas sp. TaxID=2184060 RepID=UPI0026021E26|nr:50S ribosomal protein L24e [Natronomonas sp.]